MLFDYSNNLITAPAERDLFFLVYKYSFIESLNKNVVIGYNIEKISLNVKLLLTSEFVAKCPLVSRNLFFFISFVEK